MTNKMYKLLKPGVVLISALYLLSGCYPKGPEYYSDLDLTATDFDASYSFANQKYYWMADTVEYITNIKDGELDDGDVARLLDEIEMNFAARNYKKIKGSEPENLDSAEFVITVSVIAADNTVVGWVPGYPCYWGCWGGYYPPYWGSYYSYSYTTGSVIMNWFDPQEDPVPSDTEELQPIHWVATFNGLLSNSEKDNKDRVKESINQAFTQSPYIKSEK
jgi:hypothetical protein